MVRTLLDTCVLSELYRPDCHPGVRAAYDQLQSDEIFLSVITLGEVVKGIARLPAGRRKSGLETWVINLQSEFSDRLLTVDKAIGLIWGELTARAESTGYQVSPTDGLITATALHHGLRVMTRNTKDFVATGALIIDPWQA